MNSNLFQTILTVLVTLATLTTSVLISMGCVDVGGTLSCAANSSPTWLAPYLATVAMILGILKMVLKAFGSSLTKPTVVVSDSGKPGTVSPRAVQ